MRALLVPLSLYQMGAIARLAVRNHHPYLSLEYVVDLRGGSRLAVNIADREARDGVADQEDERKREPSCPCGHPLWFAPHSFVLFW